MRLTLDWDIETIDVLAATLRRRHHQVRGGEQAILTHILRDLDAAQLAARTVTPLAVPVEDTEAAPYDDHYELLDVRNGWPGPELHHAHRIGDREVRHSHIDGNLPHRWNEHPEEFGMAARLEAEVA